MAGMNGWMGPRGTLRLGTINTLDSALSVGQKNSLKRSSEESSDEFLGDPAEQASRQTIVGAHCR